MTALVILSQDIREIELGLVKEGKLVREVKWPAEPESHLGMIDKTLLEWGLTLEHLDAIAVVTGPGAFTASRISTTIANTIAFVRNIPIISIQNPDRLPLSSLSFPSSTTSTSSTSFPAIPTYDHPPHITIPKHGDKPLAEPS